MNTSTPHHQLSRFTTPEPLETRIAPALFFLSAVAADFVVRDSGGSIVAGDLPAKTFTGADLALPLVAGDRLIYDKDGNHAFSIAAGDRDLVVIDGGRALVFLEDTGANARFDLDDDIAGITVTGGSSGALYGDSNGGLIVALLPNGTLDTSTPGTLAVQNGSLTNWKVAGIVDGDVLAGGAITNLSIGGALFNPPGGPSVSGRVGTGTATDGRSISFDGGTTVLTTDFAQPAGAAGPSITNVRLYFGAREVIAGDGANVATGNAPAGGSIVQLTMNSSTITPLVGAGDGGSTGSGAAGAGGGVRNVAIHFHSLAGDDFTMNAAAGGDSGNGPGGPGGAITGTRIYALDPLDSFTAGAGAGGSSAGAKANAGAGGAIADSEFSTQAANIVDIFTGEGGAATGSGNGGAGGNGSGIVIHLFGNVGAANVGAGDGGDSTSGRGGNAGNLTWSPSALTGDLLNPDIAQRANFLSAGALGNAMAWGGAGGDGPLGGGNGGAVKNFTAVTLGPLGTGMSDGLLIKGGTGGGVSGPAGVAHGGSGGEVRGLTLANASGVAGSRIEVAGGDGGSGGTGRGNGGSGGSFGDFRHFSPSLAMTYTGRAGDGGDAGSVGDGFGGKGGSLFNHRYLGLDYSLSGVTWDAGDGGDGHGDGKGGDGGGIRGLKLGEQKKTVTLNGNLSAHLGNGGSGGNLGTGGAGGRGGSFEDSAFHIGLLTGTALFDGGGGGNGAVAKAGGNAGSMKNFQFYALQIGGALRYDFGNGGNGGTTGAGGNGFSVSNSCASAGFIGGDFFYGGSDGGNGARGGAGGGIFNSKFELHRIGGEFDFSTGAGGSVLFGNGNGGAGGGIVNSRLDGGALTGALTPLDVHTGAGGNVAGSGTGGLGGPIVKSNFFFSDLPVAGFLFAGKGGDATGAGGKAGAGGKWTWSDVNLAGNVAGSFNVFGGAGGLATGVNARGGAGGGFDMTIINVAGAITSGVNVVGGQGNNALASNGVAGDGGDISKMTFNFFGLTPTVLVTGGFGGQGAKTGGAGGDLMRSGFYNFGAVTEFKARSGEGGASFGQAGNGGKLDTIMAVDESDVGTFILQGNDGGVGVGANARGGNSGIVIGLTLEGYDKAFQINLPTSAGGAGGTGATAAGGSGGLVSKIVAEARELSIYSADGGDTSGGVGGHAGSITNVIMIGASLRMAVAGDGGDGATAGNGGSISKFAVTGVIGDFSSAFGFGAAEMGGLSAGLRGTGAGAATNGSVSNITADKIAAIVAGAPAANALTAANAVHSLSGITTFILGADTNGDGDFDFTDVGAPGFNLGDGDTALDGLVVVRAAGLGALTVPPLKLVTVP